jgi:hypothetical protein
MKIKPLAFAFAAWMLAVSHPIYAEDSEKETTEEEMEIKLREMDVPQAVIDHIAYLADLEERYPDMSKVDVKALVEQEGEKAALLYCRAIGFDGPCAIDESVKDAKFVAVDPARASARSASTRWWGWLKYDNFDAVGVIAADRDCMPLVPYSPLPVVTIHMDDEDRRNANHRGGWIGATTSNRDTTWRFCKADRTTRAVGFGFLPYGGDQGDYAVLLLGARCPNGAKTIMRFEDNEDRNNGNWSAGNTYPNVNWGNKNWITYYCQFGGSNSNTGSWTVNGFPPLGVSYGVFGSERLAYGQAYGFVHQDDEDWRNINSWNPSPPGTASMGGDRNTWRKLVKVY